MTTDRVQLRAKIRENHDAIYKKLREKFELRNFPMTEFNERVLDCKKEESTHKTEKETHKTTKFSYYEPMYEFFGIDWSYEFCTECGNALKRKGVLTDQLANSAYTRKFDKDEPKQVEDLVAILDGGLEVNY